MVQVGCTINYGRKCLWKKRQKSSNHRFSSCYFVSFVVNDFWAARRFARVDYLGKVSENDKGRPRRTASSVPQNGPVAQLGARFHGMEEVVGSIPTRSTKSHHHLDSYPLHFIECWPSCDSRSTLQSPHSGAPHSCRRHDKRR